VGFQNSAQRCDQASRVRLLAVGNAWDSSEVIGVLYAHAADGVASLLLVCNPMPVYVVSAVGPRLAPERSAAGPLQSDGLKAFGVGCVPGVRCWETQSSLLTALR
jgi:hypothetical protein